MDPGEIDALVQRLVANPYDEDALAYAHEAGAADPKSYAYLLEKVGTESRDPAFASHWLSEAANVWAQTLGDAHRAAKVLMMAIDMDPTQRVAADRLAQLYRDKGEVRALAALLDRRCKALAPLAEGDAEIRGEVAAMYEELGRLWSEPPLSMPKRAIDCYRRALELDPESAYAMYGARELYKAQESWGEAIPFYAMELAIEADPARRLALLRDEAQTRKSAGDLEGATRCLAEARGLDDSDPALQQEYAASILDRLQAGLPVSAGERSAAAELLVALAETYDGEHGLAYASAALDADAGHDRALQLALYYAQSLGREGELSHRFVAYLEVNGGGAMSADVRHALAAIYEGAGQYGNAITVLEPLRGAGDADAVAKLQQLYPLATGGPAPASDGPRRPASPLTADKLQGILDAAQMLAGKGKKPEALAKYKEVLDVDPAHPEALAWVEEYLRTKREYGMLRDVLLASVRAAGASADTRKERLREIAGLCEGNLKDPDGAISAYKQLLSIDRTDESARSSLTRLLEKSQKWDDLANLLEQEATVEADVTSKIALEKKLATLQETKRRDPIAAAEAWSRIAAMAPEDDAALMTAAKLYEKSERLDLAAEVIAENARGVSDATARGQLYERLGEIREQIGDAAGAGEAYAEAAEATASARLWDTAERCFVAAERWDRAANAVGQRSALLPDAKQQALLFGRAAELLVRAGEVDQAVGRLEQATDLDPSNDDFASALAERYTAAEAWDKLAGMLTRRGDRLTDPAKRVVLRRQAAKLYVEKIGDKEAARDLWLKVLEDGDDKDALEALIDDAIAREDHTEAATLLRRLFSTVVDRAEKTRIALREAELLAEGVGDVDTAIARYEAILTDLEPTCRPALQAVADLQEARENPGAAADALERELKLVADAQERGQIAGRLANLYDQLADPRSAIRALDIVRKGDPDDFDALGRLCDLCEKVEQWDRVAELLAERIEVEGDEAEAAVMTRKLAGILADKLDRGDEALAALTGPADQGDPQIRAAYVELGDRLGWKGIVATKLVEWWFDAKLGPERLQALRDAFDRFAEVGRDADAVRVAIELVRAKGADRDLAVRLEVLAVKTADHDALAVAHDLLGRDLSGPERAEELVRQAEVRVRAGMPRAESMQHGESGLTSVPAGDAEPLLERLAALAPKPHDVIDLYERQVSRCKSPQDRIRGLARAAQIASARGQGDRARGFLELALAGTPTEETLAILEQAAREGDRASGGEKLRRALSAAMAAGAKGARDGGRLRGALLRRAASIAHADLADADQAFAWLGDALIAHVEPATLDAIEALGVELADPARADRAITHALAEVFDGPLVRQLVARRARIRKEQLHDPAGAAVDLKKLHDLSPTDQAVLDELSAILTDLGDYRTMVQLYEDQILRGKDMGARSELARKVARMWEEQLQDPREAADAWRRVLRMKPADPEGTAGLERAKSNMLKKPDGDAREAYGPPKMNPSSVPPRGGYGAGGPASSSSAGRPASRPPRMPLGAPMAGRSESSTMRAAQPGQGGQAEGSLAIQEAPELDDQAATGMHVAHETDVDDLAATGLRAPHEAPTAAPSGEEPAFGEDAAPHAVDEDPADAFARARRPHGLRFASPDEVTMSRTPEGFSFPAPLTRTDRPSELPTMGDAEARAEGATIDADETSETSPGDPYAADAEHTRGTSPGGEPSHGLLGDDLRTDPRLHSPLARGRGPNAPLAPEEEEVDLTDVLEDEDGAPTRPPPASPTRS